MHYYALCCALQLTQRFHCESVAMWTSRSWLSTGPTDVDVCSRIIVRYMYRQFLSLSIIRFAVVIETSLSEGFAVLEPTGSRNIASVERLCTCAIHFVNLSQASILL